MNNKFIKEYGIFVISCKKNFEKIETIKKTWYNNIKDIIDIYFIIGDENINNDYNYDNISKIITLKCKDDYVNLNRKIIKLFQYIITHTSYNKIIKIDDDVYLSKDILISSCKYFYDKEYFGYIHTRKTGRIWNGLKLGTYQGPYYEGGIYFISRNSMKYIVDNCNDEILEEIQAEDKMIGDLLRNKNNIKKYDFLTGDTGDNDSYVNVYNPYIHKNLSNTFTDYIFIVNISNNEIKELYTKSIKDNIPDILKYNKYFLGKNILEVTYKNNENKTYYTDDYKVFKRNFNRNKLNILDNKIEELIFNKCIFKYTNSDIDSNKVINMLWIGDILTKQENICISSFIKRGHIVKLWVYNKQLKNLPDKVELEDANEIIPENEIYLFNNHYAGFSDRFRWRLLNKIGGGWWCDTDIYCLKYLDFPEQNVISLEYKNEKRLSYASGIIKLSKEKAKILDDYVSNIKEQHNWTEIGPDAVKILNENNIMENYLKDPYILNPLEWYNMTKYIKGELSIKDKIKYSYTVHLFSFTWKSNNIDKNKNNKLYQELENYQ